MKTLMDADKIKLEAGWKKTLLSEFGKPYMQDLKNFLQKEMQKKKVIYPQPSEYFAAFNHTPFDNVRVVIIGQDPYHGPGQAHGLCFSVKPGVPPPPSLQNIFSELEKESKIPKPEHGCLTSWAEQGVLLLNATLTVEAGKAGSHQNKGWEQFTDRAIQALNDEKSGLVFVLWGSYAQKKGVFIDAKKHYVLKAPHPSPLSVHRGFYGCKHFELINSYLKKQGQKPIDWQLPSLQALRETMT